MPIRIKIDWLSELFQYIKKNTSNSDFNAISAKNQFDSALDRYCDKLGCQSPKADKGLPVMATLQSTTSNITHGGIGTNDNNQITPWSR